MNEITQKNAVDVNDPRGGFKKGNTLGNGRPKGAPNKVTQQIRDRFQDIANDNLDNVQRWLDEIAVDNPEKALDLFLKLSEYVLPKLARTEVIADITQRVEQVNITINRNE